MSNVDRVLGLAEKEVGYHEVGNNITKYAEDLDKTSFYNGPKNGFAWCCVFLAWLFYKLFGEIKAMEMLCIPKDSSAAGCDDWRKYFAAKGKYFTSGVPERGDIIFFYSGGGINHIGIVEKVLNGAIYTIEGNSSDSVRRNSYMANDRSIAGYAKPDYNLVNEVEDDEIEESDDEIEDSDVISTLPPRIMMKGNYPLLTIEYKNEYREDVEALQMLLCLRGFPVEITGKYDDSTRNKVMFAQQTYGLEDDGEAGPDTILALISNGRY